MDNIFVTLCGGVPSKLLRLALVDLEKCENDPLIRICMGTWLRKERYDPKATVCEMCLAGSVLYQTCGVRLAPTEGCVQDEYVNPVEEDWVSALDCFRQGCITHGLQYLIPDYEGQRLDTQITPYDVDPLMFKADMNRIITILENLGL
jgi:hypothetical protein